MQDYKTFLDFILAKQHMRTTQSLHYFFKILDLEHTGYLTARTLQYFLNV